ncbi:MAG TPA: hypothetical protein VF103_18715, partial [Polyangiaceae bacterium]
MKRLFSGVWVFCGIAACGSPPPAQPSAAKKPPAPATLATAPTKDVEPPLVALRTGAIAPERGEPLELEPVAKYAGPEFETLEFRVLGSVGFADGREVVDVAGATFAFVANDHVGKRTLWIRRAKARANEPVTGDIYTQSYGGPGIRYAFRQKAGTTGATGTRALEGEWLTALATAVDRDEWPGDPFTWFMARRVREMASSKYGPAHGRPNPNALVPASTGGELYELMDTTTGRSAIQQAIQHDHSLAVSLANDPKKLPLSAATPPSLPRADYAAMLAALATRPPVEPLAQAAPADFWFLRARTFQAFYDLLELTESWGQPTADLLGGQSEDRGTTARYTAELALERTELARVLGPSVIESVAVMGSDPYVHDGTDVTFAFKVTAPPLFDAALAKALAHHASAHGDVKKSEFVHEGITVHVARSADGRIRQHRASVAGLELVSNSPGAIRRVISAALGKAPRLADESDFRYLTARDAGTPDEVLAFLSDRFVTSVVGPAQKIAQARRQLALAELSTPGFAALVYGWTHGVSPKSDKELVKSGELLAAELRHSDGSPITFQPGKPASSRFGTTSELEPLIDLPPVEKISAAEQRAYASFSNMYSMLWSEYVDPVIVRFARSKDAPGRLDVALRALPLLRADNRDLIRMVGDARVDVPPLDTGIRWVLALGKDAELRRELDGRASFAGHSLKFDWLGDSVTFGLDDRAELTSVARALLSRKLEPPTSDANRGDELEALVDLPVYASIEVKNRVGAVVALGMLRKLADDVAREMLAWRDGGKYRDVAIT